jgi:ATP-binding cassette subfamily C protein CydC
MKALVFMLGTFWRAEQIWFLAGIAASTFTVLAGIALLGLSGWFITACALAGAASAGLGFDFFQPSAAIRFLAVGRTAGRYAERLVTHEATLRFLAALRVRFYRGAAHRPMEQLSALRSGLLLERITADVDALDNLYLRLALPLFVFVLSATVLAAALLSTSVALAGAGLALLTAASVVVGVSGLMAHHDTKRRAFALEALRLRTIDLVRAQADLAMTGGIARQRDKVRSAGRRLVAVNRRLHMLQLVSDALLSLLSATCLAGVLVLGAAHFQQGQLLGPQLVLILLVVFALLECIGPLRRGAVEAGRTILAARRLAPVLESKAAAPAGIDVPGASRSALDLCKVEYCSAHDRPPIVHDINLRLEPGERVALVGASGSGKSTVLALVAGLLQPTQGAIRIGKHAPRLDRPAIGLLTQRTELLRDTVANNLRLAAPDADEATLWAALDIVELADTVHDLPLGLDSMLGEGGCGLSGGQARRLALARIVLLSPAIWLLDEPTAGLDDALAGRVLRNIERAAGNATILIASHHVRERSIARRTIRMRAGTFDPDQGSVGPQQAQ